MFVRVQIPLLVQIKNQRRAAFCVSFYLGLFNRRGGRDPERTEKLVPSFNGIGQLPSKQFIAVRICSGLPNHQQPMVAQQAFSPQILKGKATIPWVKTRAGVPNLRDDQTKLELFTLVAKLVDASDSKSDSLKELCRFDSDLRYKKNK